MDAKNMNYTNDIIFAIAIKCGEDFAKAAVHASAQAHAFYGGFVEQRV